MSYALSGAAMTIAAITSYGIITGSQILPPLTGAVLAIVIIGVSFGYGYATRNRSKTGYEEEHQETTK